MQENRHHEKKIKNRLKNFGQTHHTAAPPTNATFYLHNSAVATMKKQPAVSPGKKRKEEPKKALSKTQQTKRELQGPFYEVNVQGSRGNTLLVSAYEEIWGDQQKKKIKSQAILPHVFRPTQESEKKKKKATSAVQSFQWGHVGGGT